LLSFCKLQINIFSLICKHSMNITINQVNVNKKNNNIWLCIFIPNLFNLNWSTEFDYINVGLICMKTVFA
jgi:hypothetical protein